MGAPVGLDSIRGWFFVSDQELMPWILEQQRATGTTGDVVELGCYLGKSAVVIGDHLGAGETFTVLDLFEGTAGDHANAAEHATSYSTLTRQEFERNYLRYHDVLPVVVQDLSSAITEHVSAGSVRFMHIDASHLYEHVRGDILAARTLLQPGGIVVLDDYRTEHTPGVSAAVWEAVVRDGLIPIVVTPSKLYGTWGDPAPWLEAIETWVATQSPRIWMEHQAVLGHDLIRLKVLRSVAAAEAAAAADAETAGAEAATQTHPDPSTSSASTPDGSKPDGSNGSRTRTVLKEVTPPIIARWLHRLRLRRERARD